MYLQPSSSLNIRLRSLIRAPSVVWGRRYYVKMGRRSPSLDDSVRALQPFTACDISDALARLKVPGAGYLADLSLVGQPDHPVAPKTIAPASTVLFAPKEGDTSSPPHVCNIPEGAHWADLAEPGTIVLLKQPGGQRNAVCGGILAQRMKVRGVVAIVAAGRVRDVAELRSTGLPVSFLFSSGARHDRLGTCPFALRWFVSLPFVLSYSAGLGSWALCCRGRVCHGSPCRPGASRD
jgi:regulator of RNase E activity RraA